MFFVFNKDHTRNNSLPFQLACLKIEVIFSKFEESIYYPIDKWIKEKMTEKNKKIRLANAKKNLSNWEGKPLIIKTLNHNKMKRQFSF
jgi:hypothetical protein